MRYRFIGDKTREVRCRQSHYAHLLYTLSPIERFHFSFLDFLHFCFNFFVRSEFFVCLLPSVEANEFRFIFAVLRLSFHSRCCACLRDEEEQARTNTDTHRVDNWKSLHLQANEDILRSTLLILQSVSFVDSIITSIYSHSCTSPHLCTRRRWK